MAVFQELIKDFNKIRYYGRDFFVYGYRSRSDRLGSSQRSYDNEKRRLESFLPDLIHWEMGNRGKRVFMKVDPGLHAYNPLYALWETKSFTRNECVLYFLIMDLFKTEGALTLNQTVDLLLERYEYSFKQGKAPDAMTVRNRLNEYVELGLLSSEKRGKTLEYQWIPSVLDPLSPETLKSLREAVQFFANASPLGVLGYFLDQRVLKDACSPKEMESVRGRKRNRSPFRFRHHFLFHTLDDQLLLEVFQCMENHQEAEFVSRGQRDGRILKKRGIPLRVVTSARHGRRFVVIYNREVDTFFTLRMDRLETVHPMHSVEGVFNIQIKDEAIHEGVWSVYHKRRGKKETVLLTLGINEEKESYVLDRIRREGKHGILERLEPNVFQYRVDVLDTQEAVPWLRTFVGRILNIEGSNQAVIKRFKEDLSLMNSMYQGEG